MILLLLILLLLVVLILIRGGIVRGEIGPRLQSQPFLRPIEPNDIRHFLSLGVTEVITVTKVTGVTNVTGVIEEGV